MADELTVEEFVCGYVINFASSSEAAILHRGTLEDCEKVFKMIPAISYSGNRVVHSARMFIDKASAWKEANSG